MEGKNYYVYAHLNPITKITFYIGKGCDRRAWSKLDRSRLWEDTVKKNGFEVLIIEHGLTDDKAKELESSLIYELVIVNKRNLVNIVIPKKAIPFELEYYSINRTITVNGFNEFINFFRKNEFHLEILINNECKFFRVDVSNKWIDITAKKYTYLYPILRTIYHSNNSNITSISKLNGITYKDKIVDIS